MFRKRAVGTSYEQFLRLLRRLLQCPSHLLAVDLSTTQRYMHLSPAALEGAIRLLDQRPTLPRRGDMVETGNAGAENVNR